MLSEEVIKGYIRAKRQYFDPLSQRDISLGPTKEGFALNIFGDIHFGDSLAMHGSNSQAAFSKDHAKVYQPITFDQSVKTEYHKNVINLQSEVNDLARELRNNGYSDDAVYMEDIAKAIEESEKIVENSKLDEVEDALKKAGLVKRIREFYDDFTDENSDLYKKTMKLRKGAKRVQSVSCEPSRLSACRFTHARWGTCESGNENEQIILRGAIWGFSNPHGKAITRRKR